MSHEFFASEILKAQRPLYVYVCSLLGNSQGADDLLQEVNLVLWRKMSEFDSQRNFMPWAYAIVRFQVLAHLKKVARQKRILSEAVLEQIAQRAENRALGRIDGMRDDRLSDSMEALENCLQKLPRRQREYIELRYRQNFSVKQIGESLTANENTVLTMLSRARISLSRCVRAALGTEHE
jgi:RNA polymerase sigma-70 factor (ECF subfamily)